MDPTTGVLFAAVVVIALNRVVRRGPLVWVAQSLNVVACIGIAVWGLPGFEARLESILRIFLMLMLLVHILENQRKLGAPAAAEAALTTREELDELLAAPKSNSGCLTVEEMARLIGLLRLCGHAANSSGDFNAGHVCAPSSSSGTTSFSSAAALAL